MEAGGKLTGVERVRRATAGNERQGVSDADIIRMGEQASREANHGIQFHVKIAWCAGTRLAHLPASTDATLSTMAKFCRQREFRLPVRTA
jgi:hypothetical protein